MKNMKIKFNYKIWMETKDKKGILGLGQLELLEAINKEKTFNRAIETTGFGFRKSWNKIKRIEQLLDFKILETHRGGADKGNTVLTEKGKLLIDHLKNFHFKINSYLEKECIIAADDFNSELKKIR